MQQNINTDYPIDVVIAWVDGNDESHFNKMSNYLEDKSKLNNQQFLTRFNQVDEIEFSVKSILKFAPFVRTIFIVTDEQVPLFLRGKVKREKYPNVKIIDHKEIFAGFESYLPTFNSVSIESMLYRIPNLAEHFIYFNDDLFLMKETKITDFFDKGFPVLRGKFKSFDTNTLYKVVHQKIVYWLGGKTKNKKYGYKKAQQNIAVKLGFKKYLRLDHTPASIRKTTIKNYFDNNPEMLIYNIQHRFRNPSQFMIQSLANHLEIKNMTCILKKDYQLLYFGSYKKPLIWYKFNLFLSDKNNNKLFLCLQSLDLCPKYKLDFFLNWLKKLIN
ncbi:Stealth CR1 domain-containing protein [Lutibacter sp.]|uniref:Stealth CR1 domain-containing protein n=1 Tax=Lutibacter sp. TaxID=1925666 RepID=UPI0025C2805A|nr:Stealth CR1 domain-containing protein [Lutibacter sp.]MCF6167446.1 stealth family protein [Lutibacter sp.]